MGETKQAASTIQFRILFPPYDYVLPSRDSPAAAVLAWLGGTASLSLANLGDC